MRLHILKFILCPQCHTNNFSVKKFKSKDNEIIDGVLTCRECRAWFRIEDSILDLLPFNLRRNDLYFPFTKKYKLKIINQSTHASKDKFEQIKHFKNDWDKYEKNIVSSNFYKAVDQEIFVKWIKSKLKDNGLFFTLDPHDSPVRFIFDLMMRFYKLYDDEGHKNHLINKADLNRWLNNANFTPSISVKGYIPPHLLYNLNISLNKKFIRYSDKYLGKLPLINTLGGIIISSSIKIK